MTDWPIVTVRLALYADLGLLFGIALFAAPLALWRRFHVSRWIALLAGAGLAASVIGFGLQMAAMLGSAPWDDPAIVSEIMMTTAFGRAFIVRLVSLGLALLLAFTVSAGKLHRHSLIGCGGIALLSLAWSGHAAAGDGVTGWVRLAADGLHLLAAGAWIGALAMLFALVSPRRAIRPEDVNAAHAALVSFSRTGTLIVVLLVATGVLNGATLLGPVTWPVLTGAPYGRLLLAKLALFIGMLGCAALNRFRLTPRLALAASPAAALTHLRRSIVIEALLAMLVLAAVAWLGTLAPPEPL